MRDDIIIRPETKKDYKDMNTTQISCVVKERIRSKLTELGCEV